LSYFLYTKPLNWQCRHSTSYCK